MHRLAGGLQEKLPYLRHLLWSENPSELQLWPEAQEQQWAGFAMQAGTDRAGLIPFIPQSSLGPLTFQSKLQSSSLSFMEVEKNT